MRSLLNKASRVFILTCVVVCLSFFAFTGMASAHSVQTTTHKTCSPHITLKPGTVTESTSGTISFTVLGSCFPALIGVVLSTDACIGGNGVSFNPPLTTADYEGRFNSAATGTGCTPGKYTVAASETQPPYNSFRATLVIRAP